MSSDVDAIVEVFADFDLKINETKTDAILFRASCRKVTVPALRIGRAAIEPSVSVRCLGLILHERLAWLPHVEPILPNCYTVVASLRRFRIAGLPTDSLLTVYKVLLNPIPMYCSAIWSRCDDNVSTRARPHKMMRSAPYSTLEDTSPSETSSRSTRFSKSENYKRSPLQRSQTKSRET